MVEERDVIVKENWEEEYLTERPKTDSMYFSDVVPEGQLSFKEEIKFKSDGEKRVNKFGKEVMHFIIEVKNKERYWEVGINQYDILRTIGQKKKDNKTLVGCTGILERVGVGQKDTRRTIQFK